MIPVFGLRCPDCPTEPVVPVSVRKPSRVVQLLGDMVVLEKVKGKWDLVMDVSAPVKPVARGYLIDAVEGVVWFFFATLFESLTHGDNTANVVGLGLDHLT